MVSQFIIGFDRREFKGRTSLKRPGCAARLHDFTSHVPPGGPARAPARIGALGTAH
jgi:hypothetical protein